MASLTAIQEKVLARLSTSGQEAVSFHSLRAELSAASIGDASLIAAAIRGLAEDRRVSLHRGAQGDGEMFLSLAANLSDSESQVLSLIRTSGTDGIDQAQLIAKLRISKSDVIKALRALVDKGHIQGHRSCVNRARRIYLLQHLQPSSVVTGGTFYCGEELDVVLVDEWRRLITSWVVEGERVTLTRLRELLEELSGGSVEVNVSSPVAVIHSRSSAFPTEGGASGRPNGGVQAGIQHRHLSREDTQRLAQSLCLDGVLEEVPDSPTPGETQYVVATNTTQNPLKHFTVRPKRQRNDAAASQAARQLVRRARQSASGQLSLGDGTPGDIPQVRSDALELIWAESLWEPAPITLMTVGDAGSADSVSSPHTSPTSSVPASRVGSTAVRGSDWSYLPAVAYPCLGCPQLASCSSEGHGRINPQTCVYLSEWLR